MNRFLKMTLVALPFLASGSAAAQEVTVSTETAQVFVMSTYAKSDRLGRGDEGLRATSQTTTLKWLSRPMQDMGDTLTIEVRTNLFSRIGNEWSRDAFRDDAPRRDNVNLQSGGVSDLLLKGSWNLAPMRRKGKTVFPSVSLGLGFARFGTHGNYDWVEVGPTGKAEVGLRNSTIYQGVVLSVASSFKTGRVHLKGSSSVQPRLTRHDLYKQSHTDFTGITRYGGSGDTPASAWGAEIHGDVRVMKGLSLSGGFGQRIVTTPFSNHVFIIAEGVKLEQRQTWRMFMAGVTYRY